MALRIQNEKGTGKLSACERAMLDEILEEDAEMFHELSKYWKS